MVQVRRLPLWKNDNLTMPVWRSGPEALAA
jgi:hypothetical protein